MEVILPINMAWVWLALAVVFILIEVATFTILTVWFAIGAIILVFLSFLPIPFVYQILIFLIISTTLLVLTRPLILKKLESKKQKTNVDSLAGSIAIVVKDITAFEKGEIKINGNIWTAKSEKNENIEKNSECIILRIEGVTAIVEKNLFKGV